MALLELKVLLPRQYVFGGVFLCILNSPISPAYADDVKFNVDLLDIKDREHIDLNRFSHRGYIMPGEYIMSIHINKQVMSEQTVAVYVPENDPKGSEACVSPLVVKQFGLKEGIKKNLQWWHQGQCLVVESLPGLTVKAELGIATLFLGVPATYLEYSSEYWDPPSTWDNGIPGILLDYHLNIQQQLQNQNGKNKHSDSANGTLGANLGPWRLRADWQARYDSDALSQQRRWDWSRYYAYRALPNLAAKLTLGEDFLVSDIFDSFRFTGASLVTDDNMLPANLRGYAPEITGVANTNAKVIISQQGRILKETLVAAGPFRIQDVNDSVSGRLDVRIEEQDGSVQQFQMETASIPYLTRPGLVRYKIAAGRPSDLQHHYQGSAFTTGEFSWGVNNGWSLYGGGVTDGKYNAAAVGIGRDLMLLGALSFDVTQSQAKLSQWDQQLSGRSYRLSYSKRFDDYDNQVTFAGYRFSEKNYMSMSEYLNARSTGGSRTQNSKEMYTVTFNQQLRDWGTSIYLNYSHQTYWDQPDNDRYNLTLARYFDVGRYRNVSLSLTAYRNKFYRSDENGVYLSLSLPWGQQSTLSYNGSVSQQENSHQLNYNSTDNDGNYYQLGGGQSRNGAMASGYYSYQGSLAQMSTAATYQAGQFSSMSASLQGGATLTARGAALHRVSSPGGTRMLVDTDGAAGIPIRSYGKATYSNHFGKAVVSDISNYSRSRISIDLDALPDTAQAMSSVTQATLTEGAIGYRHFEIITGEKTMAIIRLADGSTPPFGATVLNHKRQEVGIVDDNGNVYLSGIRTGETMKVKWAGKEQCELQLPEQLTQNGMANLLLPCRLLNE